MSDGTANKKAKTTTTASSTKSSDAKNNHNSTSKKDANQLVLVPETILRRRHDLDNLIRKRKALQEIEDKRGPKRRILGNSDGANLKFYVKKPESFISRNRSKRNATIRYNRIRNKGMQKRASNRPLYTTKKLNNDSDDSDDDDNDNEDGSSKKKMMTTTNIMTEKYQNNSIGCNMVFVIRIHNERSGEIPKVVHETLLRLKLKYIYEGVFVKYDEKMKLTLHSIEPYIIYGKPTTQIITDLIERRGYATTTTTTTTTTTAATKDNNDNDKDDSTNAKKNKPKYVKNNNNIKERIPLSDNTIIEEYFSKTTMKNNKQHDNNCYNHIICKEDIVYEIDNVGIAFDIITKKFLYPFQLIDHKTKLERNLLKLKDGKDYGDRGYEINDYIQQVL